MQRCFPNRLTYLGVLHGAMIGLVAASAFGQSSPSATGEDNIDSPPARGQIVEQQPRTTYFAPDENGTPVPLISVPLTRIQAMLNQQDGMTALTQRPPPFRFKQIEIHGIVKDQVAELEVDVEVSVLPIADSTSAGWTALPLRFHDASLLAPPEYDGDGQLFVILDENEGYQGWLKHPSSGDHRLKMRFAVPLSRAADATQLRFFPPIANRSRLKLQLPLTDATASIENARNLAIENTPGDVSVLTADDLRNQVIVTWKQGASVGERQPTSLDVRGDIRVQIDGPGVIRSTVALELQSYDATRPIERFSIRLPANTRIVSSELPDFGIADLDDSGQHQTDGRPLVQVKLDKPVTGARIQFTTQTVKGVSLGEKQNVANYEVVDAIRQSGRVSLFADEEWLVYWELGPSVRRVANMEPSDATQFRRMLASFDYVRQPCQLDVVVKPQDTTVNVRPAYRMHVSEDRIELEAQLDYRLRGARASFLDIRLNGWQLIDVGPAGSVENDDFSSDGQDRARLRLTRALSGELGLTLRFSQPLSGSRGTIRWPLPTALANYVNGGQLVVSSEPPVLLSFHTSEMDGIVPDRRFRGADPAGRMFDELATIERMRSADESMALPRGTNPATSTQPSGEPIGGPNDGAYSAPIGDPIPSTTARSTSRFVTPSNDSESGQFGRFPNSPSNSSVTPSAASGLNNGAELTFFRLLSDRPIGDLVFDYEIRPQHVTVQLATDIQLTTDRARVTQQMSYNIKYEPLTRVTLDLPRALFDTISTPRSREPVQLRINGQLIGDGWYQEAIDSADNLRDIIPVSVDLANSQLGPLTVEFTFPWLLRSAGISDYIAIPLVVPRDGHISSNVATLQATGPLRVEPANDGNWVRDDNLANADSLQAIGVTSPTRPDQIRLRIAQRPDSANDVSPPSATVVHRTWIQTWMSDSARMDRAVFRLSSGADRLQFSLPNGSEQAICLVDGVRVVDLIQDEGQLSVALPQGPKRKEEFTLELSLKFASRPQRGRMQFQVPVLLNASRPRRWFWQLLLPSSEHLLSADRQLASAHRWRRTGWFLRRQESQAQESLEGWTGAAPQLRLPDGLNRYLFGSFGHPGSMVVRTISRRTLVLTNSTVVLAAALLVIYVPRLRHPAVLLLFAVGLLAAGWAAPELAILLGQASVLGLLLGLVAMMTHVGVRWLEARHRITLRSRVSHLEPDSSRSAEIMVGPNIEQDADRSSTKDHQVFSAGAHVSGELTASAGSSHGSASLSVTNDIDPKDVSSGASSTLPPSPTSDSNP